jgi:hypothetical protein
VLQSYIQPRAFRVAYGQRSRSASLLSAKPVGRAVPHASIFAGTDEEEFRLGATPDTGLRVGFVRDVRILHTNAGRSVRHPTHSIWGCGFRVCTGCGHAVPEEGLDNNAMPRDFDRHERLTGPGRCNHANSWKFIAPGATTVSDVLAFRIPAAVPAGVEPETVLTTLMLALPEAASRLLGIDPREMDGSIRRLAAPDAWEILLFDVGGGDGGYVQDLHHRGLERELWQRAGGVLDCPRAAENQRGRCRTACVRCLRSFRSEHHERAGRIDRTTARAWLDANQDRLFGELRIAGRRVASAPNLRAELTILSPADTAVIIPAVPGNRDGALDLLDDLRRAAVRNRVKCRALLQDGFVDAAPADAPEGLALRRRLSGMATDIEIRTAGRAAVAGLDPVLIGKGGAWFLPENGHAAAPTADGLRRPWFRLDDPVEAALLSRQFEAVWAEAAPLPADPPAPPAGTVLVEIPEGERAIAGWLWSQVAANSGAGADARAVRVCYTDRYLCNHTYLRNLLDLLTAMPRAAGFSLRLDWLRPQARGIKRNECPARTYDEFVRFAEPNRDFPSDCVGHFERRLREGLGLEETGLASQPVDGRASDVPHHRLLLVRWEAPVGGREGFSLRLDAGMSWAAPAAGAYRAVPLLAANRRYETRGTFAVLRLGLTAEERATIGA